LPGPICCVNRHPSFRERNARLAARPFGAVVAFVTSRGSELPATSATATGLAQRYATALLDLAREEKKLDAVAADLRGLVALLGESRELRRLVESPVISREEQGRAILAVADKAGTEPLTAKFLGLLASRRRLFALPGIARAYAAMLAEERGEVAAEVVSAVPLGEAELDSLKNAIAGHVGQSVNVETRVDPALLGGVVVRVGSRMLDASIRTKLQHLEQSMRGMG